MSAEPADMSAEPADQPSRWAPFLPSLLAALGILGWFVVLLVVGKVLTLLARGFDSTSLQLGDTLRFGLLPDIVATVGVLFSLWLVAPVTGRLHPRTLILRSLVAAGVAAVFVWPVHFLVLSAYYAELAQQTEQGGLYDLEPIVAPVQTLIDATATALGNGVGLLPLVVLAALGSWAWQRRRIPHGQT